MHSVEQPRYAASPFDVLAPASISDNEKAVLAKAVAYTSYALSTSIQSEDERNKREELAEDY